MSINKFQQYSNYNPNTAFRSVVFGSDSVLLETELNELQQIQEEERTNLVRKMIYSGFTELVRKDFKGEPIIFNPIGDGAGNGTPKANTFLIAPFKVIINGYEIDCLGNTVYGNIDNYISVDVGDVGENTYKDSLVYLEAWFEYAKGDDVPTKAGYLYGDSLNKHAIDSRIATETSRRIVLKWNVCVANDIDFDTYPEGMGYYNTSKFSSVYAHANGQFGNIFNVNKVFCPATHTLFEGENFHQDKNLFIGGRKDYEVTASNFKGNYVYALPMFRVRRRNNRAYDFSNDNGAKSQYDYLGHESVTKGDMGYGFRPDNLYYDKIDKDDLIDIRKSISFVDYNETSLGNETVLQMFNNQLSTYQTPKTRRIQFGNDHIDYESYEKVSLVVPFDMSNKPSKPTTAGILTHDITNPKYEDSIFGNGLVIDGNSYLAYDVRNDIVNKTDGTIDFYFKPYWNGSDDNSCTILSIMNAKSSVTDSGTDAEGKPLIILKKVKHTLVLTQYTTPNENSVYKYNEAVMSLDNDTIVANRYYHFRISWTETPMPYTGQLYLYINGNLVTQTTYTSTIVDEGGLLPVTLQIGSPKNDSKNVGFLIEELVVYTDKFEILSLKNSAYGYSKNTFWPKLPKDLMNSTDVLLMPGFNSVINNYSDMEYTQTDTVFHLKYDKDYSTANNNQKLFKLTLSDDRIIKEVKYVYNLVNLRKENEKATSDDGTQVGVTDEKKRSYVDITNISGVGTNSISFLTIHSDVTDVLLVATLETKGGCGGADIPLDILKASMVKYDTEAINYNYNLNFANEVSFNDINNEYPREVTVINPVIVNNEVDTLYDVANSYRTKEQCFARLIKYHISMRNAITASDGRNIGNTNILTIPQYVYGYKVCGIISCSQKTIKNVTMTCTDDNTAEIVFKVELNEILLTGETVELELATEGYSFDYDLNSKTIMTNMHKCFTREFTAKYGTNDTFTITCLDEDDGLINGGILKSVFNVKTFKQDEEYNNILSDYTYHTKCFYDGEEIIGADGKPTNEKIWTMIDVEVLEHSFNTPIITLKFAGDKVPRKDVRIRIPIMTSYQMKETDILSIWYSYNPYQGVLTNNKQTVTRISDWTFFATTLGTGKTSDETIKLNIINNLPGGLVYGYKIKNEDIILKNVESNMATTLESFNLNKKVVFFDDFILRNDTEFSNLRTEFSIKKNSSYSQDGLLTLDNMDFNMYFDDCNKAVSKYLGAYCIVINEEGEILLFVIGTIDYDSRVTNHLKPTYGDVFRLAGRPTSRRK